MAGYTRQSIADIINGSEVTAPPLNAEFNQMAAAFTSTTGHSHDGTTGNAPKINLTTSVSGYLPAVHGGTGGKNTTASGNPAATNDASEGYAPMSMWENTTTGRVFICVGNTNNAAVWRELVQVQTSSKIIPEVTNTVDLGDPSLRFQDLWLAGSISAFSNVSIGGALSVTGSTSVAGLTATSVGISGTSTLATVDINAGAIDGTTIGASSAAAGSFTTVTTTGQANLATVNIDGGSIDGSTIGSTVASSGAFTTASASGGFSGDLTGNVTGNVTGNLSGGNVTGDVTGDLTGNVTASTGSSTFNHVTIDGTLNMNAGTTSTIQNLTAPTNDLDAATKKYVDDEISTLIGDAGAGLNTLGELADALNDDDDFSTTVTNSIATKLPKAGGTMTGAIAMSTNKITGVGDPTSAQDVATKVYTDTQRGTRVAKTGDTMSGALAMGNNKITDLAAPTATTDATNKTYVDGILGSATGAASSASAAATSETNAATSETNASNSALASAASATASENSRVASGAAQTAAETAQTAAETAETNAETAQAAAEAAQAASESVVDTHLNTSTAANGEVLSWTGTDYDWIAGSTDLELYAENPSSPTAPSATGTNAVAIGHNTIASGTKSFTIGLGNGDATGHLSFAVGGQSTSTASIAIGTNTNAFGYKSVALGSGSKATGTYGLALGAEAQSLSGSYATAIGESYASGTDSLAAAIANNTSSYGATGANSIAIGFQNKATGSGASAIGGFSNQATGSFSATLGNNNTASGAGSVVVGTRGSTAIAYKYVYSGRSFGTSIGKGQYGLTPLAAATSDATPTVLLTDDGSPSTTNQIILPNNSAYSFSGTIIAREQASDGSDYASWEIKGALLRDANAASTVLGNGIQNKLYATSGASAWDIALTADTTNGGLKIEVTGAASTNIRWVATVNTSEVTY